MRKFFKHIRHRWQDQEFLHSIERVESIVSKVLSIAMLLVILVSVYDLCLFLVRDFLIPEVASPDFGRFGTSLFNIFGLFLNVLIALEILENITAYLKKHVVQVELVIVTSLIAVARKIIILDLEKKTAMDLIALAAAILSLSLSYWIIRRITRNSETN
jgi:uncharacterized membrane protein (DUF373 family)